MAATGSELAPLRQIKAMYDSIKASIAEKLSKSEADVAYAAKSHTHTVSQITDFPEIPETYAMATDAEASGLLGY